MEGYSTRLMIFLVSGLLLLFRPTVGIMVWIIKEECLAHSVEYEGDTIHVSFVVVKHKTRTQLSEHGVDLVVRDPDGAQIYDFRDKLSEKFEFIIHKKGLYHFCFSNRSPYNEVIDFDVYLSHFSKTKQHAKDEHVSPLLEHISKLQEALEKVKFEQHWLSAKARRHSIANKNISMRTIQKAIFESAALVGASVLQVYLLRRLFERKLGTSRV